MPPDAGHTGRLFVNVCKYVYYHRTISSYVVEYNSAVGDALKSRVDDVREAHSKYLTDEVWDIVDSHVSEIEGKNRGNTSSASTSARKGPDNGPMKLTLQNTASFHLTCHEYGHALMDAFGIDATQEATNRANNKNNYSRWPQFSFGKKDSPPERFMLRRYGNLPDITRHALTDLEGCDGRSDIFKIEGSWWETNCYRFSTEHREVKRYRDPFIRDSDGNPTELRVKTLSGYTTKHINESGSTQLVDRYKFTPGLADILDVEIQPAWSGIERVIRQVNTNWYDAVTLVRKRGNKRERGQKKAPKGKTSSYYLMNCHEYVAELHAILMDNAANGKYERDIQRLRNRCPGLVESYEDVLMDGYPLTV